MLIYCVIDFEIEVENRVGTSGKSRERRRLAHGLIDESLISFDGIVRGDNKGRRKSGAGCIQLR